MRWMKTFWHIFTKSLTDPQYYKTVLKVPFTFSLKYLAALIFFSTAISLIPAGIGIIGVIPKLPQFSKTAERVALKAYPRELILTSVDGALTSNVVEPYVIEFPEELASKDIKSNALHFIVLDTKAKVDDFASYNTTILVTGTQVVVKSKESEVRMYPLTSYLSKFKNGETVVNWNIYEAQVKKFKPFLSLLPLLGVVFLLVLFTIIPLIGTLFSLLGRLVYLLLVTGVVWIVAQVLHSKKTFAQLYQMDMHAITLTIVITTITGIFSVTLPFLLLFAILIVFAGFILKKTAKM